MHRCLGKQWSSHQPGVIARWNGYCGLDGIEIVDEWFYPDPAKKPDKCLPPDFVGRIGHSTYVVPFTTPKIDVCVCLIEQLFRDIFCERRVMHSVQEVTTRCHHVSTVAGLFLPSVVSEK